MQFIHQTAIVEPGAEIASDVYIWHHCHIREQSRISESCSLGKDVYIDRGVQIGHHSRIQNGVSIYQGVAVEPWSFIGPKVIFTNDLYPRAGNTSWKTQATHVRRGASIGAGAVIICGVELGAFAMVAAGAIVTKSIAPFYLASGAPAMAHNMICACGQSSAKKDQVYTSENLILDCCIENLQPDYIQEARLFLEAMK